MEMFDIEKLEGQGIDNLELAKKLIQAANAVCNNDPGLFDCLSRELLAEISRETGYFQITTVHRNDVKSRGYNADLLDDCDMEIIASKIKNSILQDQYWIAIDYAAGDYLETPYTKEYLLENIWDKQGEKMFATVFLQAKGVPDETLEYTVKLSQEVNEEDDEDIFMNFDDLDDFKNFLRDCDNDKEDWIWVYTKEYNVSLF